MAKAKREGGLYYVGDSAVDAEGVAIKDAPKKPKDTPPDQQPGALGAPTSEEKLAIAIAQGLRGDLPSQKSKEGKVDDNQNGEEETELPTLADLPDHLQTLKTREEVEALQNTDERVGAVKMYEARLAELEGE